MVNNALLSMMENAWKWKIAAKKNPECQGDEVCTAKADVLFAIDGSGSLKEEGFEVLKNFAASLAKKYRAKSRGLKRVNGSKKGEKKGKKDTTKLVQTGVIQFGQGALSTVQEGGKNVTAIAAAVEVSHLTFKKKETIKAIKGLTWLRGFTNMAQAFLQADSSFFNWGRPSAQSTLIVISDGKPSFVFQTAAEVKKLREKGVRVVMVVVKNAIDKETEGHLREWASMPRSTNFIHINGLKSLKRYKRYWVNRVVTHSCGKLVSKKAEKARKKQIQKLKSISDKIKI